MKRILSMYTAKEKTAIRIIKANTAIKKHIYWFDLRFPVQLKGRTREFLNKISIYTELL